MKLQNDEMQAGTGKFLCFFFFLNEINVMIFKIFYVVGKQSLALVDKGSAFVLSDYPTLISTWVCV